MTKIEPMGVADIRQFSAELGYRYFPSGVADMQPKIRALILAWIHAEARVRMLEYIGRHSDCEDLCFFDESHITFDERGELPYFITAVKKEVGWEDDQ